MGAKILPLRRLEGSIAEMSDEALLAACALGDRAALGALFDRHVEPVRVFLCHLVICDAADVDDLVQTTFETLQRTAGSFRQRSGVKTWILGIAKNVARHHLRTRIRQRRIATELVHEPKPQGEILDEQLARQERILRLRAAISELTPKLREVFVLVYVQGISGTEAASILGIREGTVWKRLHVARKKVCATMGEVEAES
jgi:RNA polymerase sigma-70 factor (ECF subfamily)